MEISLKTLWSCLLLAACTPSEKKTGLEAAPEKMEDTLQTGKPDGVAVEKPLLTKTEEMPPKLTAELTKNYPGWKLPEFSEKYLESLNLQNKNLIWVRGDFDNNKQEDFAAQVQVKDSVYVIAFLQQAKKDTFRKYELEKGPLYKLEDDVKGSLYYLTFLAQNDTVYNYNAERRETLPSDAFSVGLEYGITTYFFRKCKWQKLETGD